MGRRPRLRPYSSRAAAKAEGSEEARRRPEVAQGAEAGEEQPAQGPRRRRVAVGLRTRTTGRPTQVGASQQGQQLTKC